MRQVKELFEAQGLDFEALWREVGGGLDGDNGLPGFV